MRMKILAATILAVGLATSAGAQSTPSSNATMDATQSNSGGSSTPLVKKHMHKPTVHKTSMKTHKMKCPNPAKSTGSGKLQTQGGRSNATPEDEACAAHNN